VVEVGLGGRLDATNALDPELSIITSISYDHTAILGTTLAAIAAEKAGILRPDRTALLAEQRPAAARALGRACHAVGARCRVVPPLDRPVPQAGAHQRQNAALAIAAARELVQVTEAEVWRGLTRLRWPGRFEIVNNVVLDGAHNGASAEALALTLQPIARQRPIDLVLAINRDKDARAVLRPLLPLARTVWATEAADNPRALDAASLADRCRRLGTDPLVAARPVDALEAALEAARATEPRGMVCVTGSLVLVGQARTILGLPVPERLWG
jgi:dihydrofolate synthase/folylpolyglutamate synthase